MCCATAITLIVPPASAIAILDGAFVLAIIGIIAKVSDLVLDSSQQLRFQNFLNRVTEYLIDLNILKWYPRLREYSFNIPVFLLVVAIESAFLLHSDKFKPPAHAGWQSYFYLVVWQFLMYLIIVNLLARIQRTWLFCVSTLAPTVLAVPAFLFGILLFTSWAKAFTDAYHADPQHFPLKGFEVVFWAILGFVAVASIFFLLAIVLTLLGVLVSVCYFACVTARAVLWRIVTYTKGAWAAVWLLITGVLGILELLVHHTKP
jgi:hypothetical protein